MTVLNWIRPNKPLTRDDLRTYIPSAFARDAIDVTNRYVSIPTIDVLDNLAAGHWLPVAAKQQNSKKHQHALHTIRLRHQDDIIKSASDIHVGETINEIWLTNSHNGRSSYQLHAGLFRKVCANGLIVGESTLSSVKVRHVSSARDDVYTHLTRLAQQLPRALDVVNQLQSVRWTHAQINDFVQHALSLRFDCDVYQFDTNDVIRPRRYNDNDATAWGIFNRVQETLIRGRVSGTKLDRETNERERVHMRPLNAITETTRVNTQLWDLALEHAS